MACISVNIQGLTPYHFLESIASGKKPIIEIPIPLSDTEFAFIKIPHPLTNAQWEKIESILKAYKPTDETKEN